MSDDNLTPLEAADAAGKSCLYLVLLAIMLAALFFAPAIAGIGELAAR